MEAAGTHSDARGGIRESAPGWAVPDPSVGWFPNEPGFAAADMDAADGADRWPAPGKNAVFWVGPVPWTPRYGPGFVG
ncbi:hypothetical protein GCM10009548_86490 [Streptomyces malaysiensis subsp. malaysiensis]